MSPVAARTAVCAPQDHFGHGCTLANVENRMTMNHSPGRRPVISDSLPSQLPDIDPEETSEWVESLDGVIDERGADARLDPLAMLDLNPGDAVLLRNAGARVTDDVLRALVLATRLLDVTRISSWGTPTAA
jgi:hypothetical protein